MTPVDPSIHTPVQRLTRDLANAARTISDAEARFLCDAYYAMQDQRIRADGQIRSIVKNPARSMRKPARWSRRSNRTTC